MASRVKRRTAQGFKMVKESTCCYDLEKGIKASHESKFQAEHFELPKASENIQFYPPNQLTPLLEAIN